MADATVQNFIDEFMTAANEAAARTALGLGSAAVADLDNMAVTGGTVDGTAIGGTTPAAGAFTDLVGRVFSVAGQTVTGSDSTGAALISSTWNTTGSPVALGVDIVNTASGSGARLMDLRAGGASKASVNLNGVFNLNGDTAGSIGRRADTGQIMVHTVGSSAAVGVLGIGGAGTFYGLRFSAAAPLCWTSDTPASSADIILQRAAAGVLSLSTGRLRLPNLPTSSAGLVAGDLWNDGGTVKIVT